jgi:hypothetical protein
MRNDVSTGGWNAHVQGLTRPRSGLSVKRTGGGGLGEPGGSPSCNAMAIVPDA